MKQIKYFCNLCAEEKKKDQICTFYWDSTKIIFAKGETTQNKNFGGYVLKSDLNLSDKHICKECIEIINNALINTLKSEILIGELEILLSHFDNCLDSDTLYQNIIKNRIEEIKKDLEKK